MGGNDGCGMGGKDGCGSGAWGTALAVGARAPRLGSTISSSVRSTSPRRGTGLGDMGTGAGEAPQEIEAFGKEGGAEQADGLGPA